MKYNCKASKSRDFQKGTPIINSSKALKLILSHLFQTKICKTHLLQFVKISLQHRVTFPLHVLFLEIYVSY